MKNSQAQVKANSVSVDSRVPAVIGVRPWSWKGDDNSGNMIHAAAARRMISQYREWDRPGEWTDADIEQLRSEHSHLVFVTANLIRLGVPSDHPSMKELVTSLVALTKNIERAGLPLVVFGLGSQADLNCRSDLMVTSETIRLLKVISDHSRKVAVRGSFTAETCVKLGIKNTEVVGCQSIFWHRTPWFSWNLSEPDLDTPSKIAFNFTDALSEANLINEAMSRGHDFIGQQNDAEEDLKGQPLGATLAPPFKFNWAVEKAFMKGFINQQQYERWIRDHFFQFRQPEAWFDHMRRYCFSYGTRLHGNMAALISGARALWIVHDTRTKELCDHFHLPWVGLDEVRGGVSLEELVDRADFSECFRVYPDRYRVLFDYVDRAGLPHSLPTPVGVVSAAEHGGAAPRRLSA